VPMAAGIDSVNVATAAAVAMYELRTWQKSEIRNQKSGIRRQGLIGTVRVDR